jgi:hypothetical protein
MRPFCLAEAQPGESVQCQFDERILALLGQGEDDAKASALRASRAQESIRISHGARLDLTYNVGRPRSVAALELQRPDAIRFDDQAHPVTRGRL